MPRRPSAALDGLDRFVRAQMRAWKVPGAAVAVVCDGGVALCRGFGLRDVRRGLPVTADTVFAIASCSKAFTTMLMGMLVDENSLDWDRPVREYLPDFALFDDSASERITPRDLVTHRSGLPRHDMVWYGSAESRAEMVRRLRYLEPTRDLRAAYQYQNLMFMAAGHLVGELTDSTWEEQILFRIFEPLGMDSSHCSVEDSKRGEDVALPYGERRGKARRIPFLNIDNIGPAGAINSSVSDMSRWLQLHLGGGQVGGRQLISRACLRQMHSPQMVADPSEFDEVGHLSYGLGWGIQVYRGHTLISHQGGIDGFTSRVSFLPAHGIGVVALNNLPSPVPNIVTYQVVDRLLGLEPLPWARRFRRQQRRELESARRKRRETRAQRHRNTRPSHSLAEYVGQYRHPAYGEASVVRKGRRLGISYHHLDLQVRHYHYDVFELSMPWWETSLLASFGVDSSGRVSSLSIPLQDGVADIVFERVE